MKMTPEQLKGKVKAFSNANRVSPQAILQIVMFEQILSRIEISPYHDNFVLKGGVLIASMIGVESRTTMDLDTTVRGIKMEERNLKIIVEEILNIHLDDGIVFKYESILEIRKDDVYENFRVYLKAIFGKMKVPMKIDITTGDVITPDVITYPYMKLFDDQAIFIKAYPLETILSEKYETIISRNISTTRARDFYDFYTLIKQQGDNLELNALKEALLKTAEKRGSLDLLSSWESIIDQMKNEEKLYTLWHNYKVENHYVPEIGFDEIINLLYIISIGIGI